MSLVALYNDTRLYFKTYSCDTTRYLVVLPLHPGLKDPKVTSAKSFGRYNVSQKFVNHYYIGVLSLPDATSYDKSGTVLLEKIKRIFKDRNVSVSICDHSKYKMCNCKLTLSTFKRKNPLELKKITVWPGLK